MKLICEKYKQEMDADGAQCRHPKEYCKYRTSCMIHFIAGRNGNKSNEDSPEPPGRLRFDKGNGLLPAIVQDYDSNEVLMLAYINEEAWQKTLETGKAHYWSRSRQALWLKGESSKHFQEIKEILVDCDEDSVLYRVKQLGAACHKGYRSCFFRRVTDELFKIKDEPVFDPGEVYKG